MEAEEERGRESAPLIFFPNTHHAYPHTEFKVLVSSVSTPPPLCILGKSTKSKLAGVLVVSEKVFLRGIFNWVEH